MGEQTANMLRLPPVAVRTCTVSFVDVRGVRHSVEVEAESLYEGQAVLDIYRCDAVGDRRWLHTVETWVEELMRDRVLRTARSDQRPLQASGER